MAEVLVIADDFTGANDTGALLRQRGFSTFSSFRDELPDGAWNRYEAVCINTDSRSEEGQEAKARVYQAAVRCLGEAAHKWNGETTLEQDGKTGVLVSKRIDSTLRGNIGKEIEGILEAVPRDWKAVVVPAGPRAGRICVGGYVLVEGIPLEKSGAARDPRIPVTESRAVDIIRKQTERQVDWISLEEVHRGAGEVAGRLRDSECSVVVVDAADMDDIRTIARGCVESGVAYVCVDPGDFTLETASLRFAGSGEDGRKNLLVVGSLSETSREQLDFLKENGDVCLYPVDIERLLREPAEEMCRVNRYFREEGAGHENLCITTAYSKRFHVASDSGEGRRTAELIAEAVAGLALGLVKQRETKFELIYLSGGDIAKAFAGLAGMEGVEPQGEISPLAVYGYAAGGEVSGMKILTKGGMIGDRETLHKMLSCVKMINQISVQEEEG